MDVMPARRPFRLETERLTIRLINRDDITTFTRYRHVPEVGRHQDWPMPYTRDLAHQLVDAMELLAGPTRNEWSNWPSTPARAWWATSRSGSTMPETSRCSATPSIPTTRDAATHSRPSRVSSVGCSAARRCTGSQRRSTRSILPRHGCSSDAGSSTSARFDQGPWCGARGVTMRSSRSCTRTGRHGGSSRRHHRRGSSWSRSPPRT